MKLFLALFLLVGFSLHALSQENSELSNHPGKWIYVNNNLSKEWYSERFYGMNAAELVKYHGTVEKLVEYLSRQPIAQNPLGVSLHAQSRAAYNNYDHALVSAADERVKSEIYIPFCRFINKGGNIDTDCNEVSYIKLRTNDASCAFEPAMSFDLINEKKVLTRYKEIMILPKILMDLGDGVFLYDFYYENRIIVKRNDRPLWLPITNREFTDRMVAYYNASCKESQIPQMAIDALKKEIAAIPPEMMEMPAFINGNNQRPLTGICSETDDAPSALYKLNPGYFDASLPRTSVQLITLTIEGHADYADYGETGAHRVWEFIEGLRGSELRKLLDVK